MNFWQSGADHKEGVACICAQVMCNTNWQHLGYDEMHKGLSWSASAHLRQTHTTFWDHMRGMGMLHESAHTPVGRYTQLLGGGKTTTRVQESGEVLEKARSGGVGAVDWLLAEVSLEWWGMRRQHQAFLQATLCSNLPKLHNLSPAMQVKGGMSSPQHWEYQTSRIPQIGYVHHVL